MKGIAGASAVILVLGLFLAAANPALGRDNMDPPKLEGDGGGLDMPNPRCVTCPPDRPQAPPARRGVALYEGSRFEVWLQRTRWMIRAWRIGW